VERAGKEGEGRVFPLERGKLAAEKVQCGEKLTNEDCLTVSGGALRIDQKRSGGRGEEVQLGRTMTEQRPPNVQRHKIGDRRGQKKQSSIIVTCHGDVDEKS